MSTDFFKSIDEKYLKLIEKNPINSVYGLGRSLLALGTFLTLISNNTETLFPVTEMTRVGISPIMDLGIFHLLSNHIYLAKIFSLITLMLVIVGIYPRFTGVFHWYISFSFFTYCGVIDGGDQANWVLCFLLIPLTLLDNRKWHWQKRDNENDPPNLILNSVSWSFVWLIRIQVSVIYLHAAVAKLNVTEWINGTAVYYWFTHHYHGASSFLKPLILMITTNSFFVVMITWSVILLEVSLFSAIALKPDSVRRKILLRLGIVFHFSIVIVHGLISFYFTMVAALVLYLSNYYQEYHFTSFKLITKWKAFSLHPTS